VRRTTSTYFAARSRSWSNARAATSFGSTSWPPTPRQHAPAVREHLHEVGPGFPGGQDLGRRERPGHDELVVPAAEADYVQVERRRDDELGPGQQGGPAGFHVEDGPGPQQHRVAEGVLRLADDIQRVRDRQGDLGDGDPAGGQGPDDLDEPGRVGGPDHGHDPGVEDTL
jgi:hypothetical protein